MKPINGLIKILFVFFFILQITTHAKLLSETDKQVIERKLPFLSGKVSLLSLQAFDTEQQFSNQIRLYVFSEYYIVWSFCNYIIILIGKKKSFILNDFDYFGVLGIFDGFFTIVFPITFVEKSRKKEKNCCSFSVTLETKILVWLNVPDIVCNESCKLTN